MSREDTWLRKKPKAEDEGRPDDPAIEYLASLPPPPPEGTPLYFVTRDKEIWRNDPRNGYEPDPLRPGDKIAAKLARLYSKHAANPDRYYELADRWMQEAERQRKATGKIRRRLPF